MLEGEHGAGNRAALTAPGANGGGWVRRVRGWGMCEPQGCAGMQGAQGQAGMQGTMGTTGMLRNSGCPGMHREV